MSQATALVLSILLELPVALGLVALLRWLPREQWPRLLVVGTACTLLTHPFAWHGLSSLRAWLPVYWQRAVLVEGAVAVVEGLLYARVAGLGWVRGLAVGAAANAFSYLVGLLLLSAMR